MDCSKNYQDIRDHRDSKAVEQELLGWLERLLLSIKKTASVNGEHDLGAILSYSEIGLYLCANQLNACDIELDWLDEKIQRQVEIDKTGERHG